MSEGPLDPVHVVIPTHTTRHLRLTLLGIATQRTKPAGITVTCDVIDKDIALLVEACAHEFFLPITLVQREHQGKERLAQVRNNAVRALLETAPDPRTRLLFLDGDCFAYPDTIAAHARLGAKHDLVIAYRINLTEQQTASFDEEAAKAQREPVTIDAAQRTKLAKRAKRYDRQMLERRLGLAKLMTSKAHKPKPLGGHHSVSLDAYVRVNGHDEEFHTWGTEDDDFGRRVYRSGGTSALAVRETTVLHLYHPSRAGSAWHDRENAERFKRGAREAGFRCAHGLKNPIEQPESTAERFG
ncbi:MAG: galactosyltransferase-related protein [Planctomycetota bacterium]